MALYYFTINENFQNNIDNFETTEGTDLKTEDEFNLRFGRDLAENLRICAGGLYDEFEELL